MYTSRLLLAFGLMTALNAFGQTNDLDPVTVTASLSREQSSRSGRNLFIINSTQLQNLPAHSLDEILRYLPGIETQMRGPFGSQSDIVLRGGTFQQVLVLIDGLRVNDPNTGHFTANIPISTSEIDRIEILKGASSSVYGSEAVGGVIHIITKSFASHTQANELNARITSGQYGLFSADAGYRHSTAKTSLAAGLVSNNTTGQPQRGTHGSVYAHTGSVSVSHQLSNALRFSLRTALDDRNFSAQNFYTNFLSDTAQEHLKTWWNQASVEFTTAKHRLLLDAGYKRLSDEYQFNKSGLPNESVSRLYQAQLHDEWQMSEGYKLVTGTQFIRKKIESNDRGDHKVDQAALFAVLLAKLSSQFQASPSLRLEYNERSGWEIDSSGKSFLSAPQSSAQGKRRQNHS